MHTHYIHMYYACIFSNKKSVIKNKNYPQYRTLCIRAHISLNSLEVWEENTSRHIYYSCILSSKGKNSTAKSFMSYFDTHNALCYEIHTNSKYLLDFLKWTWHAKMLWEIQLLSRSTSRKMIHWSINKMPGRKLENLYYG